MKIVFIKSIEGYETDFFTENCVYDVLFESKDALRVTDNSGKGNWVFKK